MHDVLIAGKPFKTVEIARVMCFDRNNLARSLKGFNPPRLALQRH